MKNRRPAPEEIQLLKDRMGRLAERNPQWTISPSNYRHLYYYLVAQKLTNLYDDELYEEFRIVDHNISKKTEELLDAYMVLQMPNEVQVKLFQFKFTDDFSGGVSVVKLREFIRRMNDAFLHSDLSKPEDLEAFTEVRATLDAALKGRKRIPVRVHCYYVVNGQNVSPTDRPKLDDIRAQFEADRRAHGFTFESYGGVEIFELLTSGRIAIEDEVIEMIADNKPSSYLHHETGPNPTNIPPTMIVGFCNVNQLTKLADKYSNHELFEKNVRLYLGAETNVNRQIIATVTGDRSNWFAFMNNGVSITADEVDVMLPPKDGKVRVLLKNMQVINGCQTVNSLYRAKYDPDTKDIFNANSNVLVRIYQIAPTSVTFMQELILATNSQNAITPEDLVSNDPVQIEIQKILTDRRIAYERKEGESPNPRNPVLAFSKDDAAVAYRAVFKYEAARLRGGLSRGKLFKQEEYQKVFSAELLEDPVELTQLALRLAFAQQILLAVKAQTSEGDPDTRSFRRKITYYMGGLLYAKNRKAFDGFIANSIPVEADHGAFLKEAAALVKAKFPRVLSRFSAALTAYMRANPDLGDVDNYLKSPNFNDSVFARARMARG